MAALLSPPVRGMTQGCGAAQSKPRWVPQPQPHRCRAVAAAAAQGGSGEASFDGSGAGRAGTTAFSAASPRVGGAAQAEAAPSAPVDAQSAHGFWNLRRLQAQLQSLRLAGVTAYGLFNTLYYTAAFLFAWVYVARVPSGQGVKATAKAFAGVMAVVWAGSQVTKLPRAAAAVLLAPLVDRGMAWLQRVLGLRTRRAVFVVFVAACLCLAAAVFGAVVLLWS
ncbi:TY4B-J: Transposon Ty4-J Gag-Pol poly [Micractinium conductrix]|uniref:TY4B-J: Transposon Ty4-J Gag-Pol poly n=1 Tax=Micractinium conductrix TaxID=554055 RepID=A0A2P6VAA8_9CHLO|nr:TY4B-J: Transposon Ty4-J Gag-Pol poly [Micractinium conductrix]|eukprot:PSC71015.1 TY4B-J: Transposon Ty4-J Gag-Pol poly [Micractinium conductrix]